MAHERTHIFIDERTFDHFAAQWVRPIENHDSDTVFGARFKAQGQRAGIGVKASAHVLYVEDEGVYTLQHLRRWTPRFAIQRMMGAPKFGCTFQIAFENTSRPMFGEEQCPNRNFQFFKNFERALAVSRAAGMVGDQPAATLAQEMKEFGRLLLIQNINAGQNRIHGPECSNLL
jgi:hypothetical protein